MTTTIATTTILGDDLDHGRLPPLSFTPDSRLEGAFLQAAQAATERGGPVGTIYLLHFDQPYRHARHYTGWTLDLTDRINQHQHGRGARLLAVAQAAGITWTLARTWTGTRAYERALKGQGGASRRCPLCGITPRYDTTTKEEQS